jgi:O-methyltransferase involved in polyketide biosynthesis
VQSDVAATARMTAAMRALETAREDALVHDPWAAALAGHDLVASFADQSSEIRERAASYTIVRTLAFNDWLRLQRRPQIVLLGAGFDMRASASTGLVPAFGSWIRPRCSNPRRPSCARQRPVRGAREFR